MKANARSYRHPAQGLTFVVALDDRNAEQATREIERRYNQAQVELARMNRVAMVGQLTASVVHEVSQPLAGTLTNAQLALRQLSAESIDVDSVREALIRIVRDGNRAVDVIRRVRALINKEPPRWDRLDINAAILEVVDLARSEVARNGVSLRTRLEANPPSIQGDRVQLQQVMLNLIVNAVQAMNTCGTGRRDLRISTTRVRANSLLVAVRDSGPGVGSSDLVRVFDPFYSTKPEGTGMGLSICREIIAGHGGKLWASTCAPQGAIFQFTLPVSPDEASPATLS